MNLVFHKFYYFEFWACNAYLSVMPIVVLSPCLQWAPTEEPLHPIAVNVVQPDGPSQILSQNKHDISPYKFPHINFPNKYCISPAMSTHDRGICCVPGVITHCTPHVAVLNLYPSQALLGAIHQSCKSLEKKGSRRCQCVDRDTLNRVEHKQVWNGSRKEESTPDWVWQEPFKKGFKRSLKC